MLFVGMWCGVLFILSMCGWHELAESFPAPSERSGKRFAIQSGKVGWVSYNICLTIYASTEGLYLSVWPIFRIGHPPLFLPWKAIHNPTFKRILWFETVTVDVGAPAIARLRLARKVFENSPLLHNPSA